MMINKQKSIILLTVFIDVLGIGIIIPTLPFYAEHFGASPLVITTLFAVFAFFQFFSAPFLGALSDQVGRRPILSLSVFGTAIGWFIFALANSLLLLFLGRIIDGITGGNITVAQSYLTDISKTPDERLKNFGLFGAIFGMGFTIGPALGGILSKLGTTVPFWFAGMLAFLNSIFVFYFLSETRHEAPSIGFVYKNPLTSIVIALKNQNVNLFLWIWFLFSLSFTNLESIFSLFVNKRFSFNETQSGYLLTLVGIIIALNQGILLPKLWLKKFKQSTLAIGSSIAVIVSLLGFTSSSPLLFIGLLVIYSVGDSLIRVISNSQVASKADPYRRGEIIGVMQSLTSLSAIIMPPVSGLLFQYSSDIPWSISAILVIMVLLLFSKSFRKEKLKTP